MASERTASAPTRSEPNQPEELLRLVRLVLASMKNGVLLVRNDGRTQLANPAFCELFHLEDPPAALAARARAVLRRQSEHLTRLVDDLLDVTRITRGKITLRRSRADLREVVQGAADDVRPAMTGRGVALRTELPGAEVWADVDRTRLNQVIANLLSNAVKFTRRGDEVWVALRRDGSAAEIRVRDTGAGIDGSVLPHLFEAFVQAQRTLARSEGGLGLGLAMVKGIVELHGGAVRAESAGIGKGAEFIVRLPAPEAVAPGVAARAPGAGRRRGGRVLVVEDSPDSADSLAEIVRMLGYEADVAYDGRTALAKLASAPADIVLSDIGLPGMDGYEVARAIRASCGPAVRLVALSGYAQADDVKRALDAGFDAHLAKPASVEQLVRLLG
jgi:CheY-like chemotaxis protein/two-component sensor histidine kinase